MCLSPGLSEEPADLEAEAVGWESPKLSTSASSYESSWVPCEPESKIGRSNLTRFELFVDSNE